MDLASVKTVLRIDVDGGKAGKALQAFGGVAKKAFTAIAAAGAASAAAIAAIAVKAANTEDKFYNMSRRVGESSETLSRWAYAAGQTGTSIENVETGVKTLAKNAVTGSVAFKKWGIELNDSNGKVKSSSQLLDEVADKIKGTENNTLRMAMAQDLMGRSGTQMIQFLEQGSDGLAALGEEADQTLQTVSTLSAVTGNEFNNQMAKAGGILDGLGRVIGDIVLPAGIVLLRYVSQIAVAVGQWIQTNQGLIRSKLWSVLEWLADNVLPAILTGVSMLYKAWKGWGILIDSVWGAITAGAAAGIQNMASLARSIASVLGRVDPEMAGWLTKQADRLDQWGAHLEDASDKAFADVVKNANQMDAIDAYLQNLAVTGSAKIRQFAADTIAEMQRLKTRADSLTGGLGGGTGVAPADPNAAKNAARLREAEERKAAAARLKQAREIAGEYNRIADAQTEANRNAMDQMISDANGAARLVVNSMMSIGQAVVSGSKKMGEAVVAMILQIVATVLANAAILFLAGLFTGGAAWAGMGGVGIAKALFGLRDGGFVKGQHGIVVGGQPYSDSVPAVLYPGERVLGANATRSIDKGEAVFGRPDAVGSRGPTNVYVSNNYSTYTLPDRATIGQHQRDSVRRGILDAQRTGDVGRVDKRRIKPGS